MVRVCGQLGLSVDALSMLTILPSRWTAVLGLSLATVSLTGVGAAITPSSAQAVRAPRAEASAPAVVTVDALDHAVATTSTTSPPTTVAAPVTTTTTAAPPPAPPTTVAPAPPPPPPPAVSPLEHLRAVFASTVPAAWRAAIPVEIVTIGGTTSWAEPSGVIKVSTYHQSHAVATTLAHEFGHLIAFRFGSQAFNGAAPVGWPSYSGRPEEAWADCVAHAFTGLAEPSHGLPACPAASLSWTRAWLAAGPG